MLLDDLANCGRKLTETAQAIRDFYSSTDEGLPEKEVQEHKHPDPPDGKVPEPTKAYSKEDVRAILARKANEAEGRYKAGVRNIVRKYGHGGSLTDIDPSDYLAVVKETEGLSDA